MKNNDNKGELVVYQSKDGNTEIGVKLENDDVWLTQSQMSKLFNKDTDTIGLHIKNIYNEGELSPQGTTEESSVVQKEGTREVKRNVHFFNLDVAISVGYRVNSKEGVQFRQWATKTLKNHLTKGFTYNEHRISQIEEKVQILGTNVMQFTHNVNRFIIHSARQKDFAIVAEDVDNLKKDVNNIKDLLNKQFLKDGKKKEKGFEREM